MSLASEAEHRLPGVGEALLAELERADVVTESELPVNVVRMGTRVRFRSDDGHERDVTVVYPAKADIAENRISVMTPIGAALIGMKEGASINWTARDGREHRLTVLSVLQGEEDTNVTPLRPRTARPNAPDDDPGPHAA
jgi:regulator of nucleoside diphosphate kinase